VGESSDDEVTSRGVVVVRGGATRRVGGGVPRLRGGGVVQRTTHISTESSDEASYWYEGGAVRRWLELPTSYIGEGGGAVRQWLERPMSWREGGGAVMLEGEANLP
jgi:hypothetical protein